MATQGPNSPSSAVNDTSGNSGGIINWTNPSNATASDTTYATATYNGNVNSTVYLKATGFGFSIPTGSTINGFQIDVKAKVAVGLDNGFIKMVKAGTFTGSTSTSDTVGTTEQYFTYGGSTSLFGDTWTPSDVNDSTFGVGYGTGRASFNSTHSVDHIRLTVFYTTAGTDTATSQTARLTGQLTANSSQAVRVSGQATTVDSVTVRAVGQISTSSNQPVRTTGQAASSARQDVRLTAESSSASSRNARLSASAAFSASQDARLTAEEPFSASLSVKATGYLPSSQIALDARMSGQSSAAISQAVRVVGVQFSAQHVDVRLVGTGGTLSRRLSRTWDGRNYVEVLQAISGNPFAANPSKQT